MPEGNAGRLDHRAAQAGLETAQRRAHLALEDGLTDSDACARPLDDRSMVAVDPTPSPIWSPRAPLRQSDLAVGERDA